MRFDVPTIGVSTIENLHKAGARVLAIEAGKTIVLDQPDVIALADRYGFSIVCAAVGQLRVGRPCGARSEIIRLAETAGVCDTTICSPSRSPPRLRRSWRPRPPSRPRPKIEYPDSDGKPMSDHDLQYKWIVVIKEGVEGQFTDDLNVYVAGNLLWYPVEGNPRSAAPDVLVASAGPKAYEAPINSGRKTTSRPRSSSRCVRRATAPGS